MIITNTSSPRDVDAAANASTQNTTAASPVNNLANITNQLQTLVQLVSQLIATLTGDSATAAPAANQATANTNNNANQLQQLVNSFTPAETNTTNRGAITGSPAQAAGTTNSGVCACGTAGCDCGGTTTNTQNTGTTTDAAICACGTPGCDCGGATTNTQATTTSTAADNMAVCACGTPGCDCGGAGGFNTATNNANGTDFISATSPIAAPIPEAANTATFDTAANDPQAGLFSTVAATGTTTAPEVAPTGTVNNDNPWNTSRQDIMLFGDPALNRMVPVRLSTFEVLGEVPVDAERVYSADHITDDKAYIMNRGSDFMSIMLRNPDTGEFELQEETIDLPFFPRTGAKNTHLGLELVTGVDKPMFGLVDFTTDEVVATGGRDEVTQGSIDNFDGENATGHGTWVSEHQFILPDREAQTLTLYNVERDGKGGWNVNEQDQIKLPSSMHNVFSGPIDGTFYAPLEGDQSENEPAGIAEFTINGGDLQLTRTVSIPGNNVEDQGTHHPSISPDGKSMYVGDNSGFVYVVDLETLSVTDSIPAGKGAGHVSYVPDSTLAVVTNHHDTFVTVFDTSTNEVVRHVEVATDSPEYDDALQSHTGRFSEDGRYFYNFATDSGTFFRVDLQTMELDGEIYVGGTPKQASQPGELTLGYDGDLTAEMIPHTH